MPSVFLMLTRVVEAKYFELSAKYLLENNKMEKGKRSGIGSSFGKH